MSIFHSGNLTFNARWHWYKFLFCHVVAALLFITFFWDPVRSMWQWVDEIAFLALNGTVLTSSWWSKTAAYANTKLYDKLSTLFLVVVLFSYVAFGWGEDMGKRFAAILFVGLYMTITTLARRETSFMEFGRESPSLTDLPFHNLNEIEPHIKAKVASGDSFPGDHGISCIILVTLFWFYAGWKWGLFALLVTPFFIMPRLISGAHWASDIIVGGLAYSLPVIAIAIFTPFGGWCCRKIYGGLQMIQEKSGWRARQGSNLRP